MKVFMSYSRSDAPVAGSVAEDIRQLGHAAWYDREVSGGQAWWSAILGQIRESELFAVILTARSLESQACRAEFGYASRLQRTILPVLCDDGVKVSLLPPELSRIQFVDYRAQDKRAAFALANALRLLPEPVPLPDPLPSEPPVPLSYLGDLRAQIESDQDIDLAAQRGLLLEVKKRIKDPESGEDALELLRLLRNRPDLLASVAEDIDAVVDRKPAKKQRDRAPDEDGAVVTTPPQRPKQAKKPRRAPRDAKEIDTKEIVSAAPPRTIRLSDDNDKLEELVARVAAASECWTLKVEEDSLSIRVDGNHLLLTASFGRWSDKPGKTLEAMGWIDDSPDAGRALGWLGLGALSVATGGLGAGLLMHKGTRDYLMKATRKVRRFPLSQPKEAAASIVECFGILRPDATSAVVSKGEG